MAMLTLLHFKIEETLQCISGCLAETLKVEGCRTRKRKQKWNLLDFMLSKSQKQSTW